MAELAQERRLRGGVGDLLCRWLQRAAFGQQMSAAEELRWLWLACVAALHLWNDEQWDVLSRCHVELAREVSALGELPLALSSRVYMLLFAGELAASASLVEQAQTVTEATGSNLAPYAALGLAVLRGRETEASALIRDTGQEVAQRGECGTVQHRRTRQASTRLDAGFLPPVVNWTTAWPGRSR
jgi:hypothetical protein